MICFHLNQNRQNSQMIWFYTSMKSLNFPLLPKPVADLSERGGASTRRPWWTTAPSCAEPASLSWFWREPQSPRHRRGREAAFVTLVFFLSHCNTGTFFLLMYNNITSTAYNIDWLVVCCVVGLHWAVSLFVGLWPKARQAFDFWSLTRSPWRWKWNDPWFLLYHVLFGASFSVLPLPMLIWRKHTLKLSIDK